MFLVTKAMASIKDLSGTNYAQIFKILIYYRDISRITYDVYASNHNFFLRNYVGACVVCAVNHFTCEL